MTNELPPTPQTQIRPFWFRFRVALCNTLRMPRLQYTCNVAEKWNATLQINWNALNIPQGHATMSNRDLQHCTCCARISSMQETTAKKAGLWGWTENWNRTVLIHSDPSLHLTVTKGESFSFLATSGRCGRLTVFWPLVEAMATFWGWLTGRRSVTLKQNRAILHHVRWCRWVISTAIWESLGVASSGQPWFILLDSEPSDASMVFQERLYPLFVWGLQYSPVFFFQINVISLCFDHWSMRTVRK